ncbi:FimV family protein [Moraxella sp. ZY210820]|uniref:type IV pilus assembly protein FimV n=1 Tax=unclassified Moraxella TaxID=2685852 RepID=UPI002730AA53|nr:hypothetical protein [Moraxella sp. ZY210820]WLF83379.1 hypothetical protein LU301_08920 [Moraxella sp. ZY210820]
MALFRSFKANRLTFALLAAMAVQNTHAISLQPIDVLSSPGELLYAEIRFTGANTSESINVSAASNADLASLGISENLSTEHLNFYSRSNNYGDGVITITSNRPLTEQELNVVIKINQGNSTRLQHVRTPLKATLTKEQIANNERSLVPTVVSEKDFDLNLAEATGATTAQAENKTTETKKSTITPPVVSVAQTNKPTTAQAQPVEETKATTKPTTAQAQPVQPKVNNKPTVAQTQPITEPKASEKPTTAQAQPVVESKTKTQPATQPTLAQASANVLNEQAEYKSDYLIIQRTITLPNGQKVSADSLRTQPLEPVQQAQQTPQTQPEVVAQPTQRQHVVQKNDNLWSIAQAIAVQTSQPISQVMKQIHRDNPTAFTRGDISRLRQGVTLNIVVVPSTEIANDTKATSKAKTPAQQTAKPANKPTAKPINKPQTVQTQPAKPKASQAQLSIVADSKQDSAHGSAKAGNGKNTSSANLSKKVMQAREQTVNTQRTVSDLAGSLKAKDQKLKLINARLAQLEQQLSEKQPKKEQQ